jgi:demethylmenaquinone methyltransferase/2-methoxy-6-polyprenyl-1,4-benzoquinol methylase
VAFGLRNMTHKEAALAEMCRVLRPGGRCWCWSSRAPRRCCKSPTTGTRSTLMPLLGKLIAKDADSYRYLAESIRMHPDQATLKGLMKDAGFGHVDVHNLAGGIVALHVGIKC